MKKIGKQLVVAGLSLSILFSMVACGNTKEESVSTKASFGEIWSLPSTTKVLEEQIDVAGKGSAALSYQAVCNEYESCQLFITAKEDISSFELQTVDLKKGDAVLSAENINVYVQKYVYFNDTSGTGRIPDPLIPMDAAAKYEENTIEEGKNGGLWVTIYVPKETEAGVYQGDFTLSVKTKGKLENVKIPVTVEVYDYTLSDEVHANTIFSWRHHQVAAGELDGSNDMMTAYYDFCVDYRISPQAFPLEVLSGEEYIENVIKYYDQISIYTLHCYVGHISGELDRFPELIKEQILEIAKVCTTDKNYFEKLMYYFIDEPNILDENVRNSVISRSKNVRSYLQECVDVIKADHTGMYDGLKSISGWERTITEIPSVIPVAKAAAQWMLENEDTPEGQELLNVINCICPLFPTFTDDFRDQLIAFTEKYDIELWWYGCVANLEPTPTYFIGDENLLSSRTVSWLQKKYNIQGNLYWDIAGYTWDQANSGSGYNVDLYEWPDRDGSNGLQAGDGNLVYPGAAYGIYGPLPSLRLMSIRDGMEEYELLLDIEKTYKDLSEAFGTEFSVDVAMEPFYSSLAYNGINMYSDGEGRLDFVGLRKELLKFVSNLKDGLGYAMGNVKVKDASAEFDFYAEPGTTITIGGKQLTPVSGTKYQYTVDVSKNTSVDITVSNENGETVVYNQFVAVPQYIYILNALSEQDVLQNILVTEGSKAQFSSNDTYSTDGTSVHVAVNGKVTGNKLIDASFVPKVSINTSLFGEKKLSDFTNVNMDIYNLGEAFEAGLRLYSGSSYVEIGKISVPTGKYALQIDIDHISFDDMQTVDSIVLEFPNAFEGNALSYEFYIDNITGEK